MKMFIQTPQQRANTLEALNVMWPSVPAGNVEHALREWRSKDEYSGAPPTCGTTACFGGWVEWWPPFREQIGLSAKSGVMGWEDGQSLFHKSGSSSYDMFAPRNCHAADYGFEGTDHELVTHRLQWLLDNSEVQS
jgi:hypothetical protein